MSILMPTTLTYTRYKRKLIINKKYSSRLITKSNLIGVLSSAYCFHFPCMLFVLTL